MNIISSSHFKDNALSKQLLAVVLILILAISLIMPFVHIGFAEPTLLGPDHVLTYRFNDGKPTLKWDMGTNIKPNGAAYLSLFKNAYQNVLSENGDHVVAPGTDGQNIVRLNNTHSKSIKYTTVIYEVRSNEKLPVIVNIADGPFTDTTEYKLPFNDRKYKVLRAVTGKVEPNDSQDFKVDWNWIFEIDDERDKFDTSLGDKAAFEQPDDIEIGIYIVVEDDTNPGGIRPNMPTKTGDDSHIVLYVCLLAVCVLAAVVIFFVLKKRGTAAKDEAVKPAEQKESADNEK